jgi:hypothetical protein
MPAGRIGMMDFFSINKQRDGSRLALLADLFLDFQKLLNLQQDVFPEKRVKFMVNIQKLAQMHIGQ